MITLTPEQQQADRAGGSPSPSGSSILQTNDAYYLLKEEDYERIRDVIGPKSVLPTGRSPRASGKSKRNPSATCPVSWSRRSSWASGSRTTETSGSKIGRREIDVIQGDPSPGYP